MGGTTGGIQSSNFIGVGTKHTPTNPKVCAHCCRLELWKEKTVFIHFISLNQLHQVHLHQERVHLDHRVCLADCDPRGDPPEIHQLGVLNHLLQQSFHTDPLGWGRPGVSGHHVVCGCLQQIWVLPQTWGQVERAQKSWERLTKADV